MESTYHDIVSKEDRALVKTYFGLSFHLVRYRFVFHVNFVNKMILPLFSFICQTVERNVLTSSYIKLVSHSFFPLYCTFWVPVLRGFTHIFHLLLFNIFIADLTSILLSSKLCMSTMSFSSNFFIQLIFLLLSDFSSIALNKDLASITE